MANTNHYIFFSVVYTFLLVIMMKGKFKYLAFSTLASAAAVTVLVTTPAQSQLNLKDSVALQAANPGYSQSGNANISGTMRAGQMIGDGSGLTALSASSISSGTLAEAHLPATVARRNAINAFTSTNTFSGFVGIGRTSGQLTLAESFGIGESESGFDGMYVKTAASGKPFYGYQAGGIYSFHYFDGADQRFKLSVDGLVPLIVSKSGVMVNTSTQNGALSVNGLVNFTASPVATGQTLGVVSNQPTTSAIRSEATATSGVTNGITGSTKSPDGAGIAGIAYQTTAEGTGVWGEAHGSQSTGVYGSGGLAGIDGYGGTAGVRGRTESGNGVQGISNTGDGIMGQTFASGKSSLFGFTNVAGANGGYFYSFASTGNGIGVVGQGNSPTGWAMYGYGRTGASGTKSFRIDHPLDPENKFLMHYCSEGPEPLNVYSGTITTGKDGFAWVELPEYFGEINRDPRVQLTVSDNTEDFVMSKVVGDVTQDGFRIRTSKPNVKVYWEVKAVRNDAWVKRYGAPVEVEKDDSERGKYQHPELHGAPASAAITFRELPTGSAGSARPKVATRMSRK